MTENNPIPQTPNEISENGGDHVAGVMSAAKVFLFSVTRTVIPIVVGWLISLAALSGVPTGALESAIEGLVVAVFSAVYYIVVRLLEVYVSPKLGWLLGVAQHPVGYAKH